MVLKPFRCEKVLLSLSSVNRDCRHMMQNVSVPVFFSTETAVPGKAFLPGLFFIPHTRMQLPFPG
jgi:hypothetical protein